ncbi:uncharacterized protein LOC112351280 [Selaginella moellendorffii]|uniref:uncharacterized protein LOC112351280 n=1 Tax=Selaginella moellendorffii TaxID=88036 RepID=UPI000D1C3DF3|nr:uncharacterized protein LOC112351280 [Selaginella moellendorffii]|eukprot:XP_024544613.1 uncharacterized protein LOC112351280 [Selaginella moellendorffii]
MRHMKASQFNEIAQKNWVKMTTLSSGDESERLITNKRTRNRKKNSRGIRRTVAHTRDNNSPPLRKLSIDHGSGISWVESCLPSSTKRHTRGGPSLSPIVPLSTSKRARTAKKLTHHVSVLGVSFSRATPRFGVTEFHNGENHSLSSYSFFRCSNERTCKLEETNYDARIDPSIDLSITKRKGEKKENDVKFGMVHWIQRTILCV